MSVWLGISSFQQISHSLTLCIILFIFKRQTAMYTPHTNTAFNMLLCIKLDTMSERWTLHVQYAYIYKKHFDTYIYEYRVQSKASFCVLSCIAFHDIMYMYACKFKWFYINFIQYSFRLLIFLKLYKNCNLYFVSHNHKITVFFSSSYHLSVTDE